MLLTIPTTSEPNLDDLNVSLYVASPITGLLQSEALVHAKDKSKTIFVLGLIAKIFNLGRDKSKN